MSPMPQNTPHIAGAAPEAAMKIPLDVLVEAVAALKTAGDVLVTIPTDPAHRAMLETAAAKGALGYYVDEILESQQVEVAQ